MNKKMTFILATILLVLMILITNPRQNIKVEKYVDLDDYIVRLIVGDDLTDLEYQTIAKQTGLSKSSVLTLKQKHKLYMLSDYQRDYLYNRNYKRHYYAFLTCEELLNDVHLPFVDLRTGDILITSSSITSFFRHGHAGIVIDGSTGETVEAYSPLEKSCISTVDTWLSYNTIMLLRVKEGYEEIAKTAAEYARNNLVNVRYSLFSSTKDSVTNVKRTHCAQLVYLAYKYAGIQIDQNKNSVVTAKEISQSEYFEIIEVKGFDLKKGWD